MRTILLILPGKPGLAVFPLNLLHQTSCLTLQTEEGMAVKEKEWRESTFHEG